MNAIDTNVIARYLTGDDPEQYRRATAVIEGSDVFVPTTVLLEAFWLLNKLYRLKKADALDRLTAFAGLPTVTLEAPDLAASALDWAKAGLDFADALHLAAAQDCEAFVSFDRDLLGQAAKLGLAVEAP